MEIIHKDTNKFTLPDNTKAKAVKTKKLIKPDYYRDLSEQIKAVQKAIANERGENHRFRQELRSCFKVFNGELMK